MRGNIALRCAVDAVAAEDAGGRLAQFVNSAATRARRSPCARPMEPATPRPRRPLPARSTHRRAAAALLSGGVDHQIVSDPIKIGERIVWNRRDPADLDPQSCRISSASDATPQRARTKRSSAARKPERPSRPSAIMRRPIPMPRASRNRIAPIDRQCDAFFVPMRKIARGVVHLTGAKVELRSGSLAPCPKFCPAARLHRCAGERTRGELHRSPPRRRQPPHRSVSHLAISMVFLAACLGRSDDFGQIAARLRAMRQAGSSRTSSCCRKPSPARLEQSAQKAAIAMS